MMKFLAIFVLTLATTTVAAQTAMDQQVKNKMTPAIHMQLAAEILLAK